MAGKSKQERKKRAKTKKREKELLRQKVNHKIAADQPEDVLGNNAEKAAELGAELGLERVEKMDIEEPQVDEDYEAAKADQPEPEKPDHEPVPFDPKSVVANILKKKAEG